MAPGFTGAFRSLSTRNFRLFFAGQLVSLVGFWMQTTGLAWLVLRLTRSPQALGTVTALQFAPVAALTLFGGVLADRFPKRKVLIVAQSLALVQACALGALVTWGHPSLIQIYGLAMLQGLASAFEVPTRQSFVVELVGRPLLPNAVALHSSVFNLARLLGPAVGGLVIGTVGTAATFWVNAISFVPVILVYALMRPGELQPLPPRAHEGALTEVAGAFRFAWRAPTVLLVLVLVAFIGTFGFNFSILIPLVAKFVLRVGPERFGLLSSCMGAGSVVAALAQAAFGRSSTRFLLWSSTAFVLVLGALALSHVYWITGALLACLGIAAVAFSTTANTTVQLNVPDELRGRVMALYFLLFAGSTPLGAWLTGFFAQHLSVPVAIALDAGLSGLGVAVALATRRRRVTPRGP